jgi:hypothetical protein
MAACMPALAQAQVLRGHKRGVWALEFAPLEKALLSASGERVNLTGDLYAIVIALQHYYTTTLLCFCYATARLPYISTQASLTTRVACVSLTCQGDKSIKLWSLSDGSCLRTLEGHTAPVLRAAFATAGTQVRRASCRCRCEHNMGGIGGPTLGFSPAQGASSGCVRVCSGRRAQGPRLAPCGAKIKQIWAVETAG